MIKGEEVLGEIKINNEVVGAIANLAAQEVEGVTSGTGKLSLSEMFGKKDIDKGVIVAIEGNNATVNINIVIEYGINMYDAAIGVQKRIKDTVEQMTGLVVEKVNVNIKGITFRQKEETIEGESQE